MLEMEKEHGVKWDNNPADICGQDRATYCRSPGMPQGVPARRAGIDPEASKTKDSSCNPRDIQWHQTCVCTHRTVGWVTVVCPGAASLREAGTGQVGYRIDGLLAPGPGDPIQPALRRMHPDGSHLHRSPRMGDGTSWDGKWMLPRPRAHVGCH